MSDARPFGEIHARQLISKISREELEDKYLRLQEDNQVQCHFELWSNLQFVFYWSFLFDIIYEKSIVGDINNYYAGNWISSCGSNAETIICCLTKCMQCPFCYNIHCRSIYCFYWSWFKSWCWKLQDDLVLSSCLIPTNCWSHLEFKIKTVSFSYSDMQQ